MDRNIDVLIVEPGKEPRLSTVTDNLESLQQIVGGLSHSGTFHALSLSGGKDSSCTLILMIEKDMPIDCVLYADTGMEFPEMYDHLAKQNVDKILGLMPEEQKQGPER